MNWMRRAVPGLAWLLAVLFVTSVAYRTLSPAAAVVTVVLMSLATAQWRRG